MKIHTESEEDMLVLFDDTAVGDRSPEGKKIYLDVTKKTGLHFHPQFRYCDSTVDECGQARELLRELGYELKYFSGCFDPYLCRRQP